MMLRPLRLDLDPPFQVRFNLSRPYNLSEVRLSRPGELQPMLILQSNADQADKLEQIANILSLIGDQQ